MQNTKSHRTKISVVSVSVHQLGVISEDRHTRTQLRPVSPA